jgi:nucleotide-binding universal stress UspA family protein
MQRAHDDRVPIVIATDGSEGAEAAAVEGARVARTLGTTAILVYVRPSLGSLGEPYYQEKLSEQMAHARGALDRANELVVQEGSTRRRRFSREARPIESSSSLETATPR